MKLIQRFKFGLPALLIAAGIFIASHQTRIELPQLMINFNDKLLHTLAYLVFGLAILVGLKKNHFDISDKRLFIFLLLLGGTYGMSDEIHQYFIPGRTFDIFDWLADLFGVLLSFAGYSFILKKFLTKTD